MDRERIFYIRPCPDSRDLWHNRIRLRKCTCTILQYFGTLLRLHRFLNFSYIHWYLDIYYCNLVYIQGDILFLLEHICNKELFVLLLWVKYKNRNSKIGQKSNLWDSIIVDISSTLFILRTQYDYTQTQCEKNATDVNNIGGRDQICIQWESSSWWRLDMPAITVSLRTKYACNLDNDTSQICTQWLKWFSTQHDDFKGNLKIAVIAGLFGPHQIRVQAMLAMLAKHI